MVKKVETQKAVKFEDGKFLMMGILGMPLPLCSIVAIYKTAMNKAPEETMDTIYALGKTQCRLALHYMKSKFGFNEPKQNIDFVRQQIELIGGGMLEMHMMNIKGKTAVFKNKNSPLAQKLRQFAGPQDNPCDHFTAGVCAELFEEIIFHETGEKVRMTAIETSCTCKGNSLCAFEVKPAEEWVKEGKRIPDLSQFEKSTEKIMTTHNLLGA